MQRGKQGRGEAGAAQAATRTLSAKSSPVSRCLTSFTWRRCVSGAQERGHTGRARLLREFRPAKEAGWSYLAKRALSEVAKHLVLVDKLGVVRLGHRHLCRRESATPVVRTIRHHFDGSHERYARRWRAGRRAAKELGFFLLCTIDNVCHSRMLTLVSTKYLGCVHEVA